MADLRRSRVLAGLAAVGGLCLAPSAFTHSSKTQARLPLIGPAPTFELTTQSGSRLSLADLIGKVLAINFIYTTCTDTCPTVTAKMAWLRKALGNDFGPRVQFISVSVEPEVDTPDVLAAYARSHGADVSGWAFLTGSPTDVASVVRRYGGFAKRLRAGDVEHLFLTSLVDRRGMLRVQYLGHQFKPQDMLADLQFLVHE